MQKAKIKFYQPNVEQLQSQKMNLIFSMLRQKQQGIDSLLKKYQGYQQEDLNEVFSQKAKLSTKNDKQTQIKAFKSVELKNNRQRNNILLPQLDNHIRQNQRLNFLSNRKGNSQTIEPVKSSFRDQLEMIYKVKRKSMDNSYKNDRQTKRQRSIDRVRVKSKITTDMSNSIENSRTSRPKLISKQALNLMSNSSPLHPKTITTIPPPLSINHSLMISHKNNQVSEPSDSQDQDIPLAYYSRQFKQKLTSQCVQQINYLYFSKNDSIKDWSQTLLAMFERHDKEIVGLRKKMKYLEKFDSNFFAVDIYQTQ